MEIWREEGLGWGKEVNEDREDHEGKDEMEENVEVDSTGGKKKRSK